MRFDHSFIGRVVLCVNRCLYKKAHGLELFFIVVLCNNMQEAEIDKNDQLAPRYSNGRLKKGAVINPLGAGDRRLVGMKRKLDGLTERAIAKLGQLIDSDNPAISLGAVKEVLDRNLGKSKATVQLDVTHTSVIHLQALEDIAQRKRDQILNAQSADHAALQQDDNSGSIIHIMRSAVQHNESVTIDNVDYAVDPPDPLDPPGASAVAPPNTHTDEKI